MISHVAVKEIPVFHAASVKAMSPISREIAAMLFEAGYIKIIEDKPEPAAKT